MADGRKSIKDKMRIAVLTERIDVDAHDLGNHGAATNTCRGFTHLS